MKLRNAAATLILLTAASSTPRPSTLGIQIRNVNLLLSNDIVLSIRSLRGELEATKSPVPVTFDNSDSFVVNADSAEIYMTASSLTALMNQYVFGYKGAPIKEVTTTFEGTQLVQTGKIHKAVDLPFRITASLSVTADGNVRVHAEKIQVEHLPVKGLLHFLGEDLEKLIHQNPGRGVTVDGDDLILSPASLTPPPHIHGRIRSVSVSEGSIVLTFDSGRHLPSLKPPFRAAAYIYHRGGVLRFGKLTMNDADLEIVGDRPGAFDFYQREYQKQLVAGYSKNTPRNGLIAHMVDYSHFEAQDRAEQHHSAPSNGK